VDPAFSQIEMQAQEALLDSALNSVGELSAVDGAVVIDENLKLWGFGAKLNFEPAQLDVVRFSPLTNNTSTIPLADLGGTRHQSAARFIRSYPTAMAFIASQDGNVTLFAWLAKEAKVIAIQHLQYLI
jgi:DNA integrity scanning protein DisA with diadenylate cyclase activity